MDQDDTRDSSSVEAVPDGNPQPGTPPAPPFNPHEEFIVDMERDPNKPPKAKRRWFWRHERSS